MNADAVFGWVLTVAHQLRLSQAKTLANLVATATHVGRATLCAVGRSPAGDAAKSRTQRAWRFCDNDRVHVGDAMRGFINRLAHKRKKPLLAALDWTKVRTFHTLMAAAALGGRSHSCGPATPRGNSTATGTATRKGCSACWCRCCPKG